METEHLLFEMNLHKLFISNIFLKYIPFWWWYRLMSHQGFRLDDYYVWKEFWMSLNQGYIDMNYKWEFEKFWGKGAESEKITLSVEDYDELVRQINEPPDPAVVERIKELMNRKAPWEE